MLSQLVGKLPKVVDFIRINWRVTKSCISRKQHYYERMSTHKLFAWITDKSGESGSVAYPGKQTFWFIKINNILKIMFDDFYLDVCTFPCSLNLLMRLFWGETVYSSGDQALSYCLGHCVYILYITTASEFNIFLFLHCFCSASTHRT